MRYNATCMLVTDSSDGGRLSKWRISQRRKVHNMYFNVEYSDEYSTLEKAGLIT